MLLSGMRASHGAQTSPGTRCDACATWRWYPLVHEDLPPIRSLPPFDECDVLASREWFGDGWKAFRQLVVRRGLAELIVAASPRDFRIVELRQ